MTEFVIITANDIHISDNGPRSRTDDFKQTILNKIDQMGSVCRKLNADAAIIAGDLYNLKNPVKNSHNLNRDLIYIFKKFPCPIYMIEGNHDLSEDRLESIETQPIGVLFADKTLIQLRHEIIKKDNIKISLVGIPYNNDILNYNIPDKKDCVCQICALHIYASLKKGKIYKERLYGYDELEKLSPDIFVIGHYHIDQGIHTQNGKYFINVGSMSRGALSEEDLEHHPQIGLIKITVENNVPTYFIKPIRLKVKSVQEVFDLTKKKQEQKENEEIKLFVEKLALESKEDLQHKTKTIDDFIDNMNIAETVRKRIFHFIHEATV